MREDIAILEMYFASNQVTVNIDKTQLIRFGSDPTHDGESIEMYGSVIEEVDHAKFLGVIINKRMTFKPHVDKVRSELSSLLGIMICNRKILQRSSHQVLK